MPANVGDPPASPVAPTSTAVSKDVPFLMGLARSNGELIPFAEYSNGRWQIEIPPQNNPSEFVPSDNSLADRVSPWFAGKQPLNKWYLSAAAGERGVINASDTPQRLASHCQTTWGLTTDYKKGPNADGDYDSVLALNVERQIRILSDLSTRTSVWRAVKTFLSIDSNVRTVFMEKESDELADIRRRRTSLPSDEALKRAALQITNVRMTSAQNTGRKIVFFEAAKPVRRPKPKHGFACKEDLFYQGWIGIGPNMSDRPILLEVEVAFDDCDGKYREPLNPMGMLSLDNRTYVVGQKYGYEAANYFIYEIKETSVEPTLELEGGGC